MISIQLLIGMSVSAQSNHSDTIVVMPSVSSMGYWVVETNLYRPLSHKVRFYLKDNSLIYTETLSDVLLDLSDPIVKVQLKMALEKAITRYEVFRTEGANKGYLAWAFQNYKNE